MTRSLKTKEKHEVEKVTKDDTKVFVDNQHEIKSIDQLLKEQNAELEKLLPKEEVKVDMKEVKVDTQEVNRPETSKSDVTQPEEEEDGPKNFKEMKEYMTEIKKQHNEMKSQFQKLNSQKKSEPVPVVETTNEKGMPFIIGILI